MNGGKLWSKRRRVLYNMCGILVAVGIIHIHTHSIWLNIEFSILDCNGTLGTCSIWTPLPHSMWMIMVVKIVDSLTTLYFVASYHSLTSFPAFPCANESSCVSTICVKLLTIADGCAMYYHSRFIHGSCKFFCRRVTGRVSHV